jgi:hypothetical protein
MSKFSTRGWNESVLFAVATAHVTPPDVAGAAVNNLITPLQSLVFAQTSMHLNYEGGEQPADKIDHEEDAIARTLSEAQKVVRQAAAGLTCLSNYQELQADNTGSQAKLLTPSTFKDAKKAAIDIAQIAAKIAVPAKELKDL